MEHVRKLIGEHRTLTEQAYEDAQKAKEGNTNAKTALSDYPISLGKKMEEILEAISKLSSEELKVFHNEYEHVNNNDNEENHRQNERMIIVIIIIVVIVMEEIFERPNIRSQFSSDI